ncbi:phosphonates ABC transporter periplasmic phosphonates-binding protein [Pseudomonas sp. StFLB209]|uniref:phosphonate ABC transporter substrate-binding protein n=1 Tax=Pseudomonas sp. StFLB209 TaxID=1028989 RepID=UPI0004F8B376|nr:phosphonate ABC transporter substrate-binding protein [Pseudomonas sp. StFLB209]BAP45893.1 phosphonates ABC transporter periplasmic phosphonates-binding protein [Pseudomonas sp. StFLB209]
MLHRLVRLLVSVVSLALCLLTSAHGQEQAIRFGLLSTESRENLHAIWQPLLDDMTRQTGLPVEAVFASDYAHLIEGMRAQRIDVAWLGNMAAVEAVDHSGAEVFAQTAMEHGMPGYYGLLIARKDSPVNNVGDLLRLAPQLTFGNGDLNSTSGYLVPGYYVFARQQVDPAKAFKRTVNQSHEANALDVANGKLDAASFNSENWDRLQLTHPEQLSQLKIIWKSRLIPSDPVLWRTSLSQPSRAKIRSFLLSYGANEHEKAVLKGLQQTSFIASDNDQLLPIRQLLLFKQRTEVAASTLSVDQKKARLRAIDAELARLQDRISVPGKQSGP